MSKIGEYRLGVYELLYEHPICDYAEKRPKREKSQQNVLILGNGWVGNEAFKACFWAGQAINSNLNITVASRNAKSYKAKIYDDAEKFGGIGSFLTDYPDTKLDFIEMSVNVEEADIDLDALGLRKKRYNYIIVSLGEESDKDGETFNCIVAEAIADELSKLEYDKKPMIAVFGKSRISEADREAMKKSDSADIVFFDRVSVEESTELLRIAKNINFAYAMYYNERTPVCDADKEFNDNLKKEFVDEPEDMPTGDLDIVDNFIGSAYSADSSCASAVHVSTKLRMCRLLKKKDTELSERDILAKFILKKEDPYNKLVELEHRRWYAYMATRGYRAPTPQEERDCLYSVERKTDHRDKVKLLHICMCRSDDRGVKLGNNMSNWKTDPKDPTGSEDLSDLDKASLRAHILAEEAVKKEEVNKRVNELFTKLDTSNAVISNYRRSVSKLLNDDDNSIKLYEDAFEAAQPKKDSEGVTVKSVSDGDSEIIGKINGLLRIVKERNRRADFVAIDAQLIDFTPFCLWYRQKYGKVITVSSETPLKDVVIPTLFCAEKAVFCMQNPDGEYVNTVREYYNGRGAYTEVKCRGFRTCDKLIEMLEGYRDELESGEAIINLVNTDPEIIFAVSRFMYRGDITAVTYDSVKGRIVSLSGWSGISAGLNNKSLSVDEVIKLMGGERSNPYDGLSSQADREKISEIFREYYVRKNDKAKERFIWSDCAQFFGSASTDIDHLIYDSNFKLKNLKESDKTVKTYSARIPVGIYDICSLDFWFRNIEKYYIISDLAKEEKDGYFIITFSYCEETLIKNIISLFEVDKSVDEKTFTKRVLFTPALGIKLYDLNVSDACVFKKTADPDDDIWHEEKLNCLRALEKSGFIMRLEIKDETVKKDGADNFPICRNCSSKDQCGRFTIKTGTKLASFTFKNSSARRLLKVQGTPFEEITYHLFNEFGAFSDVQTGVKIKWNKRKKTYTEWFDELAEQELFDKNGRKKCGYYFFCEIADKAQKKSGVENEIDIIATNGMTPIFGSCKTNAKLNENSFIYEIKSIADQFGAIPVFIIAQSCEEKKHMAIIERAKQSGVSMIGSETLWDKNALIDALEKIKNGKTVSVLGKRG